MDEVDISLWKKKLLRPNVKEKRRISMILHNVHNEQDGFNFNCSMCNKKCTLDDLYIRNNSNVFGETCLKCVTRSAEKLLARRAVVELELEYSIEDLQYLLSNENFQQYLNITFKSLLDNSLAFGECPQCSTPFQVEAHTADSIAAGLGKGEHGVDHKAMSKMAEVHYLANRIRCRSCEAVFCNACLEQPYHSGFNCEEFKQYKNAPHCRFCESAAIPGQSQFENPIHLQALENVCNAEECVEKSSKVCINSLDECGHWCDGLLGELHCLPCLKAACVEARAGNQAESDMCGICASDDLGSAPCIQLKCEHIFHFHCVESRIEKRWPGARIGFNFLNCPMCNKEIAHPSLIEHLEPIFAVWQEILEKVQERVRIEALEEEDRVNDPESRFFNDPVSYGLSIYAFYECFHCHKPFFGGRRDCEANLEEDVKPEDLVCRKCSDVPQGQCDLAEHAEYILWKCRFCCEPAIWFCNGTTHFCDYCHSHDAGGRMAGTAGNQKERAKCPPPGKE
eukprot:1008581_1